MSIESYVSIGYFIVGIVLSFLWWKDEYEAEYEYEKEQGNVEEPIAILTLFFMAFFWPIKLVKNYLESFTNQ